MPASSRFSSSAMCAATSGDSGGRNLAASRAAEDVDDMQDTSDGLTKNQLAEEIEFEGKRT